MSEKLQAPIEIELKIGITNGKGQIGTVTIGMGHGSYPTEQDLRERVAKFASEEMPDDFRLMSKREWFNNLFGRCRDEDDEGNPIFMNYAMPGGEEWSD